MKLEISITPKVLRRSMFCGYLGETTIPTSNMYPSIIGKSCAVAVAIRDIFPDATVGTSSIYTNNHRIPLPADVEKFIKVFDSKKPEDRLNLESFSFEIEVPSSLVNTVDISEIEDVLMNHESLRLIEI